MHVVGTIPITEVATEVSDSYSAAEAVKIFQSQHPTARLCSIDGVCVRGVCRCGEPVMQETKGYRYDTQEGKYVCPLCVLKEKQS